MDAILNIGIDLILVLQMFGAWLLSPMQAFSALGHESFYLLIAPAAFWCLDPAAGLRLGIGLMLSGAINSIFKLLFHGPRPYWFDPEIKPLSSEVSFGIPSAHAQNAVVFWGLLAYWIQRTWAWIAAILLMLLIGISRLYLGMHFPSDVIVGWILGILLLWLIIRLEKPFLDWFHRFQPAVQILIVFGSSLGLILIGALVRLGLRGWQIPQSWIELSSRAPGAESIHPLSLSGLVTPAGALFGLACGAIMLNEIGWLDAKGSGWLRLGRYLLGLVGVIAFWKGLDVIFPDGDTIIPLILRFIRYTAIGLWVTYLAPLLFFKLKLAKPAHLS